MYRVIANIAYWLHWDALAEWAMRRNRKATGKNF